MFRPVGVAAVATAALLLAAYAAAYALLRPFVGPAATLFAVIPPVVGAALLGLRWGIGLSAITLIATIGLWIAAGEALGAPVLHVGSGIGVVVVGVTAAAVGHLRDLNLQMAERLRERERLVEQLQGSEEQLRTVIGGHPAVYLMIEPDGRIWRSDGPGLAALGLAAGALDGRMVLDLCGSDEDRAAVRLALDGRPATGGAAIGDRRCSFSWFPTVDRNGVVTGIVGVALP